MMNSYVPICLYRDFNSFNTFLTYPKITREKEGNTFVCGEKPNAIFQKTFWVMNPDTRPIPENTSLFVFKRDSERNENRTMKIEILDDPFDRNFDDFRAIMWTKPISSNMIPLYFWEYKGSIVISLSDKPPTDKYTLLKLSPLWVLEKNMTETFSESDTSPSWKYKARIFLFCLSLLVFLISTFQKLKKRKMKRK